MSRYYLVRLIASEAHGLEVDELIQVIKTHGTDRYDSAKKQVFDDFYDKYNVDFFAEPANDTNLDSTIVQMAKEFASKTFKDRGDAVVPDIAIIYDATKCRMIEDVYQGQKQSDCYQFTTAPSKALVEVRKLST